MSRRYYSHCSMEGSMNKVGIKCPREGKLLNVVSEESVTNECQSCRGVLVDIKQIPAVRKLKHQRMLSLKTSELHCPICHDEMRVFTYKGVDIDICSGCKSVWLDPGEEVILDKTHIVKKDTKWYKHLDPVSAIVDVASFRSTSNSTCSSSDSGVLDFLGDAIGSVLDGL